MDYYVVRYWRHDSGGGIHFEHSCYGILPEGAAAAVVQNVNLNGHSTAEPVVVRDEAEDETVDEEGNNLVASLAEEAAKRAGRDEAAKKVQESARAQAMGQPEGNTAMSRFLVLYFGYES